MRSTGDVGRDWMAEALTWAAPREIGCRSMNVHGGWSSAWVAPGQGSTVGLVLMFARMMGEVTRDEYRLALEHARSDARTSLRIFQGHTDQTDRARVQTVAREIMAAIMARLEGRATFEVRS